MGRRLHHCILRRRDIQSRHRRCHTLLLGRMDTQGWNPRRYCHRHRSHRLRWHRIRQGWCHSHTKHHSRYTGCHRRHHNHLRRRCPSSRQHSLAHRPSPQEALHRSHHCSCCPSHRRLRWFPRPQHPCRSDHLEVRRSKYRGHTGQRRLRHKLVPPGALHRSHHRSRCLADRRARWLA